MLSKPTELSSIPGTCVKVEEVNWPHKVVSDLLYMYAVARHVHTHSRKVVRTPNLASSTQKHSGTGTQEGKALQLDLV